MSAVLHRLDGRRKRAEKIAVLLTAVTTTILFISSVFTPWGAVIGAIPVTVTTIGWFWPKRKEHQDELEAERESAGRPQAVMEGRA